MNFEHLIQINDPLNPFVESHDPRTMWEGLVLRAEQPQLFVIGLDRCDDPVARRRRDRARTALRPGHRARPRDARPRKASVRYDILPTADYVGGSLTMTIEQPDELQLFLRFAYATTAARDRRRSRCASDAGDREVGVSGERISIPCG